MNRFRERLTYSNVMVTLLAFIVLGGTAWAVAKNSVGSKQIKKGAVKTADIANQAINGSKVEDGSLGAADLAPGTLAAATTVRSATQTVPLTCNETQPVPGTYFLNCAGQATVSARCENGEHATGGGHSAPPPSNSQPTSGVGVSDSRPDPASGTPNGWTVAAFATGSNSGSNPGLARPPDPEVTVHAVCSR